MNFSSRSHRNSRLNNLWRYSFSEISYKGGCYFIKITSYDNIRSYTGTKNSANHYRKEEKANEVKKERPHQNQAERILNNVYQQDSRSLYQNWADFSFPLHLFIVKGTTELTASTVLNKEPASFIKSQEERVHSNGPATGQDPHLPKSEKYEVLRNVKQTMEKPNPRSFSLEHQRMPISVI